MLNEIYVPALGNYQTAELNRVIPLRTEEDYTAITTAGYLNRILRNTGRPVYNGDIINAYYDLDSAGIGINGFFTVSVGAGGVVTLAPLSNPNEVTYSGGATVIGDLPMFSDIAGNITTSNIPSANVMTWAEANPDSQANIIYETVTNISAANLNSGAVALFTPAADTAYVLLWARTGGSGNTDFSGGGGDRNLGLSVGATAYASIPAATAQALSDVAFILGGGTDFAYAAGGSGGLAITAANPLTIANSGGTTNYSVGNISFELALVRIPL